jgi:Tol biopolymer transport system component
MDGSKIKALIVGGSYLKFPTWSPDGKYIAFLLKGQLDDYHNEIQFYDFSAKKVTHKINTDDVFAPGSYNTYPDPTGPMSWINTL